MKNFRKALLMLIAAATISLLPANDSIAGKYKMKYGHSRFSCWWQTVTIKIFGWTLKEGDVSEDGHGHLWY